MTERGKMNDELTPARVWVWPVAEVSRDAYDGDTIGIDVDLGRGLLWRSGHSNVRLAGIDAPELRDSQTDVRDAAYAARDYLRELLPVGTAVRLESVGYDKYEDRVDAIIVRVSDGLNVNQAMLDSGHAVPMED